MLLCFVQVQLLVFPYSLCSLVSVVAEHIFVKRERREPRLVWSDLNAFVRCRQCAVLLPNVRASGLRVMFMGQTDVGGEVAVLDRLIVCVRTVHFADSFTAFPAAVTGL